MPKVCNIDIENRKEIYKKLKDFIKALKTKFSIKYIYLYGSFARDEIHEGSDIDLVIVGDFKGRIFERIYKVISLTDLPVEPLVYTEEEFERMRKTNDFLKQVIKTGKRL